MLNGFWDILSGLYRMRNYRQYEWLSINVKADADTNKHANNNIAISKQIVHFKLN